MEVDGQTTAGTVASSRFSGSDMVVRRPRPVSESDQGSVKQDGDASRQNTAVTVKMSGLSMNASSWNASSVC